MGRKSAADRALDRAAVKKVVSEARRAFGSKVIRTARAHRKAWDAIWRRVRLRCPICEDGYFVRKRRGEVPVACPECNTAMEPRDFWEAKATVVLALFEQTDYGPLWPYFLVELKEPAA